MIRRRTERGDFTKRALLAGVVMLTCASCTGKQGSWNPLWNWQQQEIETRAAWDDATGGNLQYREGASSHAW